MGCWSKWTDRSGNVHASHCLRSPKGRNQMTDKELISKLKSKITTQRSEIARLIRKLETLTEEKSSLLRDVKWMRGEKT